MCGYLKHDPLAKTSKLSVYHHFWLQNQNSWISANNTKKKNHVDPTPFEFDY